MDLFSRRIIAHNLLSHLRLELVLGALLEALKIRQPEPRLIHHSDRGSQYKAQEYTQILENKSIMGSMSGKDNCYDNATMESCFGTIKHELQMKTYPNFHTAKKK